jgi:hypothetical protein
LVTGFFDDLLALINPGENLIGNTNLVVEPGTWQLLGGTYARSVTAVNYDRLRASPPGTIAPDYAPDVLISGSLPGSLQTPYDLKLHSGYNIEIRQDNTEKMFVLSAGIGLGAGRACQEVKLTPNEVPPAGSIYLSGGPACNELITSINGQTGKTIQLIGRGGTKITATGPHELTISFELQEATNCPPGA